MLIMPFGVESFGRFGRRQPLNLKAPSNCAQETYNFFSFITKAKQQIFIGRGASARHLVRKVNTNCPCAGGGEDPEECGGRISYLIGGIALILLSKKETCSLSFSSGGLVARHTFLTGGFGNTFIPASLS